MIAITEREMMMIDGEEGRAGRADGLLAGIPIHRGDVMAETMTAGDREKAAGITEDGMMAETKEVDTETEDRSRRDLLTGAGGRMTNITLVEPRTDSRGVYWATVPNLSYLPT